MPVIKKTVQAEEDLIETWVYVAQDSFAAADGLLDDFGEKFILLAQNSKLGRARPDIAMELRYFPVGSYLILYRQIDEGVEIVRVVHGARLLSNLTID
jgi:toxin ParE1/3/4